MGSDRMNVRSLAFRQVRDICEPLSCKPVSGGYMFILTHSRAELSVNGSRKVFPAETAVVFDDSVRWECFPSDGALVCDWICFEAGSDAEYLGTLDIPLNTPLCFADTDFISELVRNISSEFYSLGQRRGKMLDTLMKLLLVKLSDAGVSREETMQTADPHYSSLAELRAKIYRNPQQRWNVDSMAAEVNMSRSYFQHIYRETFGVSCIADVINSKIEKAKEILSETACTVSQVAAMCGYDNEEHFMRQFKKATGVTPTGFRKNL